MKLSCSFATFLLASTLRATSEPAAFNAAVQLYRQRKPVEAQQAFEVLAASDPRNADVQSYLGRLALQRSEFEKAVAILERAVALAPNDARIHQQLGDAYGLSAQKAGLFAKLGLARKCRAEYEKAVELDPRNIDARWSLMEYYRQAPGFLGGGGAQALGQAQAIKRLDPNRGRIAVASIYAADNRIDAALAEFEEAMKVNPDDYGANYQFGRIAAQTGQRPDAGLAALRRCLTLTPPDNQPPHAAAHWRIGNILEKKGDKDGARAAYEAALQVDPKFPQAIEALKKL